jgi:hypothetical protein
MIALTAYGIRKAYKKQQARKAQKEQSERESNGIRANDPLDESRSTISSSYRQSPDLHARPVNGGLVSYDSGSLSSLTRVPSASPSGYSASLYSQKSSKDPLEEMRQYRAYIQRQSHDYSNDINPPTYEFVVQQDIEPCHPWKSELNLTSRTGSMSDIQQARHIPQGLNRVVEIDSSSESSSAMTDRIPLRLFHARSPITHESRLAYLATEVPADLPEHIVTPTAADRPQASLDEIVAEGLPRLRSWKSEETDRYQLSANEIISTPLGGGEKDEHGHKGSIEEQQEEKNNGPERLQLKRPRAESESESGSELESKDNEKVIVRFDVADRTKRPLPKRVSVAED